MDRRSSLGQTWMTVLLIASLWFTSRSNKTSDPSMQELLYAGTVVADLREFHRGFMRSLLHSPLKGTTVHDGLIGGWRRGWESYQLPLLDIRILLILRCAQYAKNAQSANRWYTAGTRRKLVPA